MEVRTRQVVGDRIVMRAGALTEISGSKGSNIDIDTMLPGGARISPGGTVYLPDGTSKSLQDGQTISLNGTIQAATPEEIAIANATLASGTAGTGQQARDRMDQTREAALQANRTMPAATGTGSMPMMQSPVNAVQPSTRMSIGTAVNAEGPTQGAPVTPPQRRTNIREQQ